MLRLPCSSSLQILFFLAAAAQSYSCRREGRRQRSKSSDAALGSRLLTLNNGHIGDTLDICNVTYILTQTAHPLCFPRPLLEPPLATMPNPGPARELELRAPPLPARTAMTVRIKQPAESLLAPARPRRVIDAPLPPAGEVVAKGNRHPTLLCGPRRQAARQGTRPQDTAMPLLATREE